GQIVPRVLPNSSTNSFRLRSIRHRTSIYYRSHLRWNRRWKSRLCICYQDGGLSEEKEEACEQTYGFMALGNLFLIWFMDFSCSRQRCIYLPKVSFFSRSFP
ncbi:unnamed protein product, partial [Brassica rapa]